MNTIIANNLNSEPTDNIACLHHLFEAQVEKTPNAVAIVYKEESITYRELNDWANALAHRLLSADVQPNELVGINAERGFGLVIAIIGVLKAGAAYLPLDPIYPNDRLQFMAEDAKLRFVVTAGSEWGPTELDLQVIGLKGCAQREVDNPNLKMAPENLAYAIYTSGSTGKPKGTLVSHHNVTRLFSSTHHWFNFNETDVWTLFHSYAFDFSVWEIWGALLFGGRLVIVPQSVSRSPRDLRKLLVTEGVTVLNQTPSAFLQLLREDLAQPLAQYQLKYVIFGGEALEFQGLRPWFERYGDSSPSLINMYGITETTVHVTYKVVRKADLEQPRGSIIGEPIPDLKLYVMRADGTSADINEEGEMYVGGAGVAQGYLNRPQLTAERFIVDPNSPESGAKLYRTGDLARVLGNGEIEYLGRIDHQVKIRGFRIETGEIEACIAKHGWVEGVSVLACDIAGDKRLVAYIACSKDSKAALLELKQTLKADLPDYMVPAHFVFMDELPLTVNGKVDRKQLPPPQMDIADEDFIAPRNELEQIIAEAFAQTLGLTRVGIHDNFFELGGHSLLVMEVVHVLQRQQLTVGVSKLFLMPTVAELALVAASVNSRVQVPANRIPSGCQSLQPDMLSLVSLSAKEIRQIENAINGGAENIQDIYPLTHLQQGMLYHHQISSDYDPYIVFTLLGAPSRDALERYAMALQKVADRHDILRTAFFWSGLKEPVQVVCRSAVVPIIEVPAQPQGTDIAGYLMSLSQSVKHKIDPRSAPLIKLFITYNQDREQWLMLRVHHHLLEDHTADELMSDEICQILHGSEHRLPAAFPYRDLVARQRFDNQQEKYQQFFTQQLSGLEAPSIPFDLASTSGNSAINEHRLQVDQELAERVYQIAAKQRVSSASLFHLAWALVIAKCCGHEDVVFGTVLFGRMSACDNAGSIVGPFINTLPLRAKLGSLSVAEALIDVYRSLAAITDYEQAPLTLAQSCSGLGAGASLFSALINYRHLKIKGREHVSTHPMEAAIERMGLELLMFKERTNYPLQLSVDDLGSGFMLEAQAQNPIDPERICNYVNTALLHIVAALETSPQGEVGMLDIVPATERQCILQVWNNTARDYQQPASLHQLIEQQVIKSPDNVALEYGDSVITYAELDSKANQLARYLVEQGVRQETLVGIFAERSIEMVIALIAILKAGGAYVPLDPSYPSERLGHMLEDAQVELVLTQAHLESQLPSSVKKYHILDVSWADYRSYSSERLGSEGSSSDLAYVIFTSGSTGRPKGAMNEHLGICNRLLWMQEAFALSDEDCVVQKTPFSFDVSVWEFFWPLMTGARLVIARPDGHRDAQYLADLIRVKNVTTLHFVPSMLRVFLELKNAEPFSSVKRVICSGEALPHELQERFFERFPDAELHNLYGPTEAAVDVTHWPCVKGDDRLAVPIGKPIANTQMYILDQHLAPVPMGVAGDLYIGGVQVGRGYIGRDELTRERFIADPFSNIDGARLYKTGDLARYLPDGNIEYLGRSDFQVKIRGQRIELGEIEAILEQQAGVSQCVVVLKENTTGDQRLVAYVVSGEDLQIDAVKESLFKQLPQHMVPTTYVSLTELPLTPSGKVDRKSLPVPEASNALAVSGRGYVAPTSDLEAGLVDIWQDVLSIERVGIYDNFFELGGHSLLAVRLVEEMRSKGMSTDVSTIFRFPRIADLAESVKKGVPELLVPENKIPKRAKQITPDMLTLVDLTQEQINKVAASVPGGLENIQDIYPLAPLQEGFLFHHMLASEGDLYIMETQFAFDSRERLDRYLEGMQWVVNRHDIQRTLFLWQGLPQPLQVVCREASLCVEELFLDAKKGDIAQQLSQRINMRNYRIDLAKPPLLRVFIAEDLVNNRWVFHQLSHHLVEDHITANVYEGDLNAYLGGRAHQLPTPQPYRNYVSKALRSAKQVDHTNFFTELLSDLDLPTSPYKLIDVLGDGADTNEARAIISGNEALKIYAASKTLGVSVASLFHLAWSLMLSKVAVSEDIVFGTVLLGRTQGGEENSRVLGPCINTLPFRIKLGNKTVTQSVKIAHELLAAVLPFECAPLGEVQRCSGLNKNSPLFNSIFNYRRPTQGIGKTIGDPSFNVSDAGDPVVINTEWFFEEIEGREFIHFLERTNYPITMSVDDFGKGFRLVSQTQSSIEPQRICDYMATGLQEIVGALVSSPNKSVTHLNILPFAEKQHLLTALNNTARDYDLSEPLHCLIEKQAAKTPTNVALEFSGQEITYVELDRSASQLAHFLIKKGIACEALVGVFAERSIELVISLLAILKAGGAYVPLDPSYPAERLANMLEDAKVQLVLTQEHLAQQLPSCAASIHVVDRTWATYREFPAESVGRTCDSHHLAYVIFTSGSTGRPKGAMNEHRAICNRLPWMQEEYQLGSLDRVLQKTPFSFDVSVWEFFWPLMTGARLVIARPDGHRDPAYLVKKIQQENITTLHFVPSMLRVFLECDGVEACRSIKRVICSGEALSRELQERFFERFPDTELHNLYGPTEAAVDVSHWACQKHDDRLTVPIGRPIANTQLYILDGDKQLAPVGVEGELYIGGVQVGRGYVGRDDLTCERFINDPFSHDDKARLYKTGDLARYLPDGNIDYLGRTDFQVKIRGQRIELGEIEAVLDQQDGVAQSVVILQKTAMGDAMLVAYVVADEALSVEALKKSMLAQLPQHMVPMTYVVLKELPLTSSGKVDRKALPAPELGNIASAMNAYVGPRDDLEICLANVWQNILGVELVGIHDDFFDLGGHSLSLIRLVVEMKQAAGIDVDIGSIFQHPTIAGLVANLESIDKRKSSVIVPLQAEGEGVPIFCISGINIYKEFAASLGDDQPVYGVYVSEEKDIINDVIEGVNPTVSTEQLLDAYCEAIMRYKPAGPYRLAGISFGGVLAVKLASKLTQLGAEVDLVVMFDSILPSAVTVNWRRWLAFSVKSVFSRKMLVKISKRFEKARHALNSSNRLKRNDRLDKIALKGEAALFARTRVSFVADNYKHNDFKVVLFRASQSLNDLPYHDIETSYGWRDVLGDSLYVEDVEGTHLSLIQTPNVSELAKKVRGYLS